MEQRIIASEFAEVAVSLDTDANGPRLRIEDLRGGRVRHLDALELESVVWLPEERLRELLDPSAGRWSDRPGDE
ncbi:hypothetical protein [Microtetraspora sp. NBRC 16547]|uniref:hypothetical protein n=1 Tax=Microtetraspora sp. NBRC 16547 TaxID=3030993 RepID=UPI0024A5917D|nr:hypothetical protein [Microtetraspora sp. NBRC 16547]GLX02878.1 hypothetical protein Misp02_69640 [Microtetraspora sp. NBRC 16547]